MPRGDWAIRFRKEHAANREEMIEKVVEALSLAEVVVGADLVTSWLLLVPSELGKAEIERRLRVAGIPPLTVS